MSPRKADPDAPHGNSKLNEARQAKVLEAIGAGCTYEIAAAYAGVTDRTLYTWLRKGAEAEALQDRGEEPSPDDAPYLRLHQEVREANGRLAFDIIGRWRLAARVDWRAAQAFTQARGNWLGQASSADGRDDPAEELNRGAAALSAEHVELMADAIDHVVEGLGLSGAQRRMVPGLLREALTGVPVEAEARELTA